MKSDTIDTQANEETAGKQLAVLTSRIESQDAELVEKDDIICALTDRLEQVAEQLDRVKRSGGNRGPKAVPEELFAHQTATTAGIQTLVDQFEGIDVGQSFGRLEMLISEVRDLVIEQGAAAEPRSTGTPDPVPVKSAPASALGGWESIKNQLLGVEPAAVESADHDEAPSTAEHDESCEAAAVVSSVSIIAADAPPIEPLPAGLPEPVDFENADRDALVEAIEARDKYITLLTRRVEDRRAKLTVPTDWDALASAPESLVEAVQQLHDELNDVVRTAEVEICLERARLSRDRTQLEHLKSQIETRQSSASREPSPSSAPEDKSSRWRRMLGLNSEE